MYHPNGSIFDFGMEGVWWELGDIDWSSEAYFANFSLGTSGVYLETSNYRSIGTKSKKCILQLLIHESVSICFGVQVEFRHIFHSLSIIKISFVVKFLFLFPLITLIYVEFLIRIKQIRLIVKTFKKIYNLVIWLSNITKLVFMSCITWYTQ